MTAPATAFDERADTTIRIVRIMTEFGESKFALAAEIDSLRARQDELVEALTNIAERFHRCMTVNGTDPEFADEACRPFRSLLSKVKG